MSKFCGHDEWMMLDKNDEEWWWKRDEKGKTASDVHKLLRSMMRNRVWHGGRDGWRHQAAGGPLHLKENERTIVEKRKEFLLIWFTCSPLIYWGHKLVGLSIWILPAFLKAIYLIHRWGIYIRRTDAEAEAPILWPPDVKSRLIGKDWWWERLKAKGEGGNWGWDG